MRNIMKQYRYVIASTRTTAASKHMDLGSTLGTDKEFNQDTDSFEWEYETNTPLQIGELISTRGWGCYEVRAIYRWVDVVNGHTADDQTPTLQDSHQDVDREGQHTLYVLTREVDYCLLTRGIKANAVL